VKVEGPRCECGCEQRVGQNRAGEWNRFIRGHSAPLTGGKGFRARPKRPPETRLCRGGCGQEFSVGRTDRTRAFYPGHNPRGPGAARGGAGCQGIPDSEF
jgi:hypothetical protein